MKQAGNNEVDMLLRSLVRGKGQSSADMTFTEGNGGMAQHLDADELNSYAEGLVAGPARDRYVNHLADCDRCRSLVVTLSQAAGVAARYEVEKQPSSSGFWSSLAAIFSPAVLRFAVPALVVTAVIGISIIVLRDRANTSFVAKNEDAVERPAASTVSSNSASPELTEISQPTRADNVRPEATSLSDRQDANRLRDGDKVGAIATGEDRPAKLADSEAPVTTAKAPAEDDIRSKSALEPQAPPPPRTAVSNEAGEKERVDMATQRENRQARQEEYKERPKDETSGPNRGRGEAMSRRVEGLTASGPLKSEPAKRKADTPGETRIVSGRHFRREGNAWVDVAYEAGRATTNVTRGSEQYRALVADEPGLRAFAEQLGGEVIVVWRGRAYKFR